MSVESSILAILKEFDDDVSAILRQLIQRKQLLYDQLTPHRAEIAAMEQQQNAPKPKNGVKKNA